jgi:hypothetical protein
VGSMSDTVHNRIVIALTIFVLLLCGAAIISGLQVYLCDAIEFFLIASIFDLIKLYKVKVRGARCESTLTKWIVNKRGRHEKR